MGKINITNRGVEKPASQKKSVTVSPNPTRTSVWVDADGNEIDRRTKRIIKKNTDA